MQSAAFTPEIMKIFPRHTEEEQKRWKLLRQAYIDSRYDKDFQADPKDLLILMQHAEKLQEFVFDACMEKIRSYYPEDPKSENWYEQPPEKAIPAVEIILRGEVDRQSRIVVGLKEENKQAIKEVKKAETHHRVLEQELADQRFSRNLVREKNIKLAEKLDRAKDRARNAERQAEQEKLEKEQAEQKNRELLQLLQEAGIPVKDGSGI